MELRKIQYLPLVMFIWVIFSIVVTYVISVCLKQVPPIFPYISDTGTFTPTRCIFGLLLNIGSLLYGLVVYVRYLHIKYLDSSNKETIDKLNVASLYIGWLASLGVAMVGNFQETVLLLVHLAGAFMAFGLGSFYIILQCCISSFTRKECHLSLKMIVFRWLLAIISVLSFFGSIGFAILALMNFHGKRKTQWKKSDGGFELHLVSTTAEWILAFAMICYMLTFWADFKTFKLIAPTIKYRI